MLGTKVIKIKTANSTKKSGMICLDIAAIPTFAIELETNRQIPIGGVTRPIIKLKITTIPKCTGSIPRLIAIGCRIGSNISIAAIPSRNRPTTSKITLTRIKNIQGLDTCSSTIWLTVCGTLEKVSNQFAAATTPITIRITDESRIARMKMRGKLDIFKLFRMNTPANRA